MTLEIIKHRLAGPNVRHVTTNNTSGHSITPKFIVMHHTARLDYEAVVEHFQTPSSKDSAHLVIDTDGATTQVVPFDVKAWHAGASYWSGYSDVNSVSIGIELINYGQTPHLVNGLVEPRRRGEFDPKKVGNPDEWLYAAHPLEPGQMQYWQKYTKAQFDVLDELIPLLVETYKIREIVGHEDVAVPKGRKVDPGPAFPLAHYKAYADHGNGGGAGKYVVVTSTLNVRGGPGTQYEIIAELERGASVKVLTIDGNWALIQDPKGRGYIHTGFIQKV